MEGVASFGEMTQAQSLLLHILLEALTKLRRNNIIELLDAVLGVEDLAIGHRRNDVARLCKGHALPLAENLHQ